MKDSRTIVLADHHKSVFVCTVVDRATGETRAATLESRPASLKPFLESLPRPGLVFVEACRAWEWVADLCEELGIELRLVDPSRMPEIARSHKKTDRHDVEAMLTRLLAVGRLPESYRASRAERELRSLTRRLSELRHDRRKTCYRIHALLDAAGLPAVKSSFTDTSWREEMSLALPAQRGFVLRTLLDQLDLLERLTEEIETRLEELVGERADVRRLQAIPGIGPVIAATIVAEVADITRFPSARAFAAYTGLVPRVRSSAGEAHLGHITRGGPPDLRWALGQAAMVGLRAKVSTAASRLYRRKVKKGKRKKVALCAAAHKLARIVYVILRREEVFRPAPPRRAA